MMSRSSDTEVRTRCSRMDQVTALLVRGEDLIASEPVEGPCVVQASGNLTATEAC
jgi:hypothetical protein